MWLQPAVIVTSHPESVLHLLCHLKMAVYQPSRDLLEEVLSA